MRSFSLVSVFAVAAGIGVLAFSCTESQEPSAGQIVSDEEIAKEYCRFREPKEGVSGKDKFEVSIWTGKEVYTLGEPVKLYIELLKTEGEVYDPTLLQMKHHISNPELLVMAGDSRLIIKKEDEEKFVSETMKSAGGDYSREAFYSGDYIAKPEEIERFEVRARMKAPTDGEIFLNPGDSVVVRINDIRKLFPPTIDMPKPGTKPYMYIERREGCYRIQYIAGYGMGPAPVGSSNIIEFEIR